MGRVLLCIGKYAEKPYFVEKAYKNVYSAEELCYCLMENSYLIDEEIVDQKLADWLREACGLPELADRLKKLLKEDCTAGRYVGEILEYVGYGSSGDIERAKENLEKETGLNLHEKKKARADYLTENGKYMLAVKNYDSLLEELPEAEKKLRAEALHNRGVAYAELFRFSCAADSFLQAYECGGGEESYIAYLAAMRFDMEETAYVDFAAKQPQSYEASLKVEKLMEDAAREFEGTEESRMLFTLRVCKEEDHTVSYYEEMERITGELKEKYREIAAG